MISRPWTAFLFSLACASTIAWLVALLHEKNVRPVQDLVAFFKKQSKAGRVILGAAALSLWAFASTKQGTSEVGEVEGSATLDMENEENRRHGDREEWVSTNQHESAQISIRDNSCQFVDKAPTGGEETPRLPSSNNSVFSDSNSTPGYLLTHVGTNEVFSFDPPDGAIVCADWRAFGAAEDWICLAFPDWAFRFDANEVDTLRVHSDGWGEPLVRDNAGNVATSRWLAPFRASLGIVPEVNWPRISTNLHESVRIRDNPWTNSLASLFWHCLTPSNTLVLTWRDALLHRSPANPVSFQAELFPDGRLVCRYDLSRLVSESVTNATVGASLTGRAWMTNAISASVTSLHFHPLDENDRLDSDADSDGLLTADEIFVHGTDPHRADSDADGLSDPDELVAGTDPRNPDTDGDGLLDGEEVSLGTGPLSADGDADGLSDFAEVRVHGTNPNRADTDGDGIPDADEVAGTTNPVRADTDGDGLDDAAELRLGTSPGNPDTDGDGVPDGVEVEQSSDPADATDGGRPASRVPVAFTFGDPSGSHSEKYRLVVKPSRKPDGQKPASVEEPRSFEWVNAEYGACETKTAMLLRGWTYEVRMFHAGTDIEDGSPDYDYSLSCLPPSCVGVVTNDPQRLFGSNGNSGESFEAEGKVAEILVLDGCLVGDYDRRDGFTDYDLSRVYRNRPLRHWINDDDDDGDTNEGDGDIPGLSDPTFLDASRLALGVGREPDYFNGRVDGRCDILDFTPVWIDMGRALRQLTTLFKGSRATDYALTLSQPEGAVNVVWTSLSTNNASRFLSMDVTGCGESLDERLEAARTVRLTKEETRLPDAFVEKMREDRANGVFLFEGRALENGNCLGTKFITLRCYRKPCTPGDGSHLFELKLPVSISPVEDMFRWVDERWVCGDTNGIPTRLGSPWNNPDSECDGTHYVFVHGYNVSAQSARGWAAEMFKRLRQSGSQAMFTAVDWYGNDSQLPWFIPKLGEESPNYYVNVEHAFDTAWQFAQDFNGNLHLPGRKIVLAHSLGNVLASSAAKDFDLQYGRYYMLNAAVPMEAYDSNAFTNAMIDCDWRALTNRVHSTDWWRLFAPSDGRQLLTWRGRFDGIKNAVNCYSPGEDTLGNITDNHGAIASMWNKNFWAAQELNKGTKKLKTLPESWGHAEGGWGFNPQLGTFDVVMGTPTAWLPRRAARRTDEELIRNPIFRPFDEAWLCSTGNVCSNAVRAVRARILADGIPATSFAAGANELKSGVVRDNINYTSPAYLENGYPRGNEKWRHSSLKQFAYYFAFRFFEKIVEDEERSYEP